MDYLPNKPKCPLQVPTFFELPSSCCCGLVKLGTASRFFCVLRLVLAIFFVSTTLEDLITADFERPLEHTFNDEAFLRRNNISLDKEDIQKMRTDFHRSFIITYYCLTTSIMVFGLIELILCSLHIHGARKKLPNFVRPYVIWTGIMMTFISIILLFFISILIRNPHIIGVFFVLATGGILSLCATDFIYALAYWKQMRAMIGLDHVRLNEI